jgi:hypothetical protein
MQEETLRSYLTELAQHGHERYIDLGFRDRFKAAGLAMSEDRELFVSVWADSAEIEAFISQQYCSQYPSSLAMVDLWRNINRSIIDATRNRVSEVLEEVRRELFPEEEDAA